MEVYKVEEVFIAVEPVNVYTTKSFLKYILLHVMYTPALYGILYRCEEFLFSI